ncbi:hypothetical protein [Streptomyces achromogenes]|uniref:hypothetical protein n=1 Tax=Streptomyces achromogenes TaxID=67255 RepID=UPI003693FF47
MPGRIFRFTATVTDIRSGKREQVADTAHFDSSVVTTHEAIVAIQREFLRQNKTATNIRIHG